jgi:hypothetical protein
VFLLIFLYRLRSIFLFRSLYKTRRGGGSGIEKGNMVWKVFEKAWPFHIHMCEAGEFGWLGCQMMFATQGYKVGRKCSTAPQPQPQHDKMKGNKGSLSTHQDIRPKPLHGVWRWVIHLLSLSGKLAHSCNLDSDGLRLKHHLKDFLWVRMKKSQFLRSIFRNTFRE